MVTTASSDAMIPSPRRKLWLTIAMVLGVLGIAVAVYSTSHHLQVKASGQTDAACNINAQFNCDTVALSAYSEVGGIPVAVFGIGYFLAICILAGVGMAGSKNAKEHIQAYAAMVLIGVLTSLALAGISQFKLSAFCPSCMMIYALTLAQLILLTIYRAEIPGGIAISGLFSGGATAAIAVALVVLLFSVIGPKAPVTSKDSVAPDLGSELPTLASKVENIPIARTAYAGLGEDYRKGGEDARIVIVEFADFQCPACKNVSETLTHLHKEFGNKIQVVFRNYPLDNSCNSSMQGKMHEFACQAAILARCAGQYGKFWPYYDLVYGNQKEISAANLKVWGTQVGLTNEQMDTCLASPDILAKIKEDVSLGNKLGINSTPTLYINGQKVVGGHGMNDLRRQIEERVD